MSAMHPLDLLRASIRLAGAAVGRAAEVPHSIATPCHEWSLGTLVRHVSDSARSLHELLRGEPAGKPPLPGCSAAQAAFTDLDQVVAATSRSDGAATMTALMGSYELTLHAWDINEATSVHDPVPAPMIQLLLVQAPLVLAHGQRSGLFGPEIAPTAKQSDLDRLLALFGRSDQWRAVGG